MCVCVFGGGGGRVSHGLLLDVEHEREYGPVTVIPHQKTMPSKDRNELVVCIGCVRVLRMNTLSASAGIHKARVLGRCG